MDRMGMNSCVLVGPKKVVSGYATLRQYGTQSGTFDRAMSRQCHHRNGSVGLSSSERDVVTGADNLKPESPHGTENSIIRRISGKSGHDQEMAESDESDRNHCLGHESLQNRILFGGCERRGPESPDVKGDR